MNHYLFFVTRPYSFEILRPLQAAIQAKGDRVAWFFGGDATAQLKGELKDNEQLIEDVASANAYKPCAVFVPGNVVPDFIPGIKVQVFHGFGIEKKGHFVIRGFFDLYCTHGPATTKPFQALAKQHGYFKVHETGWPKMDPLFIDNQRDHFRAQHTITKPLILYAPTFSPSLTSAPALMSEIKRLAQSDQWFWLIKFHPKMDKQVIDAYQTLSGPNLSISTDTSILPLLQAADVLLTDTSSVISECLLLDKPVVTYHTLNPGPHVLNIEDCSQLENTLKAALDKPTELMAAARTFIGQMHPYRDGQSSLRVLAATQAFIQQETQPLKPKPLNLWRKLQIRLKLHYYHFK